MILRPFTPLLFALPLALVCGAWAQGGPAPAVKRPSTLAAKQAPAAAGLKAARESLATGKWKEAEAAFKAAKSSPGEAALGLAELYLLTGRYPESAAQAAAAAAAGATKSAGLTAAGEVAWRTGKPAEAVTLFRRAVATQPPSLRARALLGAALLETGKRAEGEKLLDAFFADYNAGRIDAKDAAALTYTAMAAARLDAAQDASDTFGRALEVDPRFHLANLEWGRLFLQKYNQEEAARCFAAVLKINPNHPDALAGLARVQSDAGDNEKASALAAEALGQNPRHTGAILVQARLFLDDERYPQAEEALRKVLVIDAASAEAMALMGAARYLQEDASGSEGWRRKALGVRPGWAGFDVEVAELATRHHRYGEAVQIARRGLESDPEDASALALAGLNTLRLGIEHEAEGLKLLDQAFQRDGFNLRAFNTLNLYEEIIAKDYGLLRQGSFVYRMPASEKAVLERYVPPLVERARKKFIEHYGYTPPVPVTVELFKEREHYAARTTGLPDFHAQGTCFGPLITAMSPSSAEANWEQVLWHELAHTFHLQLTRGRAPRWFTEGLSEYECFLENPSWRREHTGQLVDLLEDGRITKLENLSSAFTRPDLPGGVTLAYHQASLTVRFLAEGWGFPSLVKALKLYGEGRRDDQVLQQITGRSLAQLDADFGLWLRKTFPAYERGWSPEIPNVAPAKALQAAMEKPADATAQLTAAAALLQRGKPGDSEKAVELAAKAVELDGKLPLARFVLARAHIAAGDAAAAVALLTDLAAGETDGFQVRVVLGAALIRTGDAAAARTHLEKAREMDPERQEPGDLLIAIAEKAEDRPLLLREQMRLLTLNEHDWDNAQLAVQRALGDKAWAALAAAAPAAIAINPLDPGVHLAYGQALLREGKPKEAVFELESTILAGAQPPTGVGGLLAAALLASGDRPAAVKRAEEALRAFPADAEARKVLAGGEEPAPPVK